MPGAAQEILVCPREEESVNRLGILLAKCCRRQGLWQSYLPASIRLDKHTAREEAARFSKGRYKEWHAFALANFDDAINVVPHTDQTWDQLPEHHSILLSCRSR